MNDIKNKIFELFGKAEKDNIEYNDLASLLTTILDGDVNQEDVYSFLDLLHFSSVSKIISDNNSNYWALKISNIIEITGVFIPLSLKKKLK